jgi:translation initiation factor IF-3
LSIVKEVRINQSIRVKEVRLVGPDGAQLGIVPIREALNQAANYHLDLVEVAPNASPPVCRIMDYGKYRFQQAKKHGKQKTVTVKEIKLKLQIGEHDLDMKIEQMRKFLEHGDRVKISMFFKGREIMYIGAGEKVFEKIKEELADKSTVEVEPKLEGKRMAMMIIPKGG